MRYLFAAGIVLMLFIAPSHASGPNFNDFASAPLAANASGNVGVGAASPRAKMEVSGGMTITGDITVGGNALLSSEYDAGSQTAAFTIDWRNPNTQKVTVTGTNLDITFTDPSFGVGNFLLRVIQGGGNDTINWAHEASIKWPSGIAPTLSTTAGAVDIVTCYYVSGTYYCSASTDFQ